MTYAAEAQLLQTGMDVASPKAKAAESAAPIQPPKVGLSQGVPNGSRSGDIFDDDSRTLKRL